MLSIGAASSVAAQGGPPQGVGTPAGGGDKNLADDGVKMRSAEIERMKKEAGPGDSSVSASINKQIVAKFPEIKEDYEGIQIAQDSVIKAYTTGKTIDYGVIAASAEIITQKAKRLDLNLFAESAEKKGKSSSEKVASSEEKPKSIKDLIVDLDNAIGSFVSSKLFANIQVIEPSVAVSARTDLVKIMRLSESIAAEAKKLK
jgi:hypothetical protein